MYMWLGIIPLFIYVARFIGHEDTETYFTETERTRVVSDIMKGCVI